MWLIGKKNYKNLSDQELIALYRDKNDKSSVGVLFERYAHLVFGVCLKYLRDRDESKDATLQIFEKLMQDLKRFEIEKFNFWIHRVAKNHCLMIIRNRKRMYSIDLGDDRGIDEYPETHQLPSDEGLDTHEDQLQRLEAGILTLNEEQRICIELFYLKKSSYQDVAEISGFTMNEVKSFIQNGKRNLKIYMIKHNNEISKSK